MNKARNLHLLLLGLLLSLVSAIVSAQTTTVIKFSLVAESDTPKAKAALRFKELVEHASQRRMRVDVYPNNLLYKESDELEALQLGAIQMLAPTLSRLSQFGLQDFEVFDLPFLFKDRVMVSRVTEGAIGKALLKKVETKGMVGLAYWDNGFKVMTGNRPLQMPRDFAGMKMRIFPSRVLDKQMDALGAMPQIIDAKQINLAMKAKLIDGSEGIPLSIYTRKLDEVQTNLTVSNHGYMGSAVVVNKKFWESLPSTSRTIIERALREATTYGNDLAEQANAEALETLKKQNNLRFHTLSEKEERAWREALQPVRTDLENRIGKAIVSAVVTEANRVRPVAP